MLMLTGGGVTAQSVTRGPYLQSATDSSIRIMWSTDSLTQSWVYFGTSISTLNAIDSNVSDTANHDVLVDSLIPNTTYYYAVGDELGQILFDTNYHFKTAPIVGSTDPMRFWVTGDFGKGNPEQLDVMNSYIAYAGTQHTDAWLWLGDNAYEDGTQADYQANVFDKYDSIMPYLPIFPNPGNHDYRSVVGAYITHHSTHYGPYLDIVHVPENGELGGVPSSTEAYYSFDYGNVHLVSLNSEVQSTGAINPDMEAWLAQDLAANNLKWTVVFTHQPPYSKGSYDTDISWELGIRGIREVYLPILEQYDIDLLLSGHSHNYERSMLIKGHYDISPLFTPAMLINGSTGNPDLGERYTKYTDTACANGGTIYCVMGNSGSKTGVGNDKGLNHPVMHFSEAEDNVCSFVLDVHGDTLTGAYLRHTGVIPDRFQIIKKSCPTEVIESPVASYLFRTYNDYGAGQIKLKFEMAQAAKMNLKLYDVNGATVLSRNFGTLEAGSHYFNINSSSFASGMYLLVVSDGQVSTSKKAFKVQ
jgi:hypothetical protein